MILVGSLFSSNRITTSVSNLNSISDKQAAKDLRTIKAALAESLAFRNPLLLKPADEIVQRLGGSDGFIGVHARVGDGEFSKSAQVNMEEVWHRIAQRLDFPNVGVVEDMWERVRPQETQTGIAERRVKRGEQQSRHTKRAPIPLAPLRPLSQLVNLTCRAPLHTSPSLALFNTPLYLATDSRSPTTDPVLSIFFAAFPCTFILADFESPDAALNEGQSVESIQVMKNTVNKLDGMPLGRLLLPFLEAVVAAKGVVTVGTKGSTFSGEYQ